MKGMPPIVQNLKVMRDLLVQGVYMQREEQENTITVNLITEINCIYVSTIRQKRTSVAAIT